MSIRSSTTRGATSPNIAEIADGRAMTTNLLLDIAWTHVTARVRQTLVGMAGVAMGVGFTIMMAGLMQGSQIDFLRQLVDTMPHITVQDERRAPPAQPADREYGAVQMSNVANVGGSRGIKYPESVMASLRSWIPGDVAPSVRTTAIIDHGGGRVGITLVGIDPRQEVKVSKLVSQMREGQITDLNRAPNAIIIGQALAEKLAVKPGNSVTLIGGEGTEVSSTVVGVFRSGLKRVDESQIYSLLGFAQVMMGHSGVINELRLRLNDPLIAQKVATQVEAQSGYKSVSWQEANADLLSSFSVRDFIVLTVMGAMLLTSSFATYNIISTITHEKRQDIAIMKSLGMREYSVRRIFIIEAAIIGVVGILSGWALGYALCYSWSKITIYNTLTGTTVPLSIYYSPMHYIVAGGISLLCCTGAAFFPARKATSVHPVEIIRGAS
jgi:lipoprotein-releasing system permease protein